MRFTKSPVFVFLFLCSYCATPAQDVAPVKDSFVVNQDTAYSNKDVDVIAEYPGGDAAHIKFLEKMSTGLSRLKTAPPREHIQ